jgi:branched-chain amino acid transport system ATP-binding protein
MLKVSQIDVYYGKVQALWEVSFNVEEREIVSLVGANGAGKSTLLKTISGILHPSKGTIDFDGEPIHHLSPHQIFGFQIVHVPEGRKLFPFMTVKENLQMGSYYPTVRKSRSEILKWVYSLFPVLEERETQLAHTLSGGEQQMLAIARGLMGKPKILLLDEPSIGLGPLIVRKIFEAIEKVNQEGVTVLLVEQNVNEALNLASRAYVLENGRITMEGTGKDLLNNDHVREAYLGI